MAYRIKRSEKDMQAMLRRLAQEQVQAALEAIEEGTGPDSVHKARTACKKLRGLIRLVRPAFPDFKQENAAIRDAGQRLAGQRDHDAMVEALDRLADRRAGGQAAALAEIRAVFAARSAEAAAHADTAGALAAFVSDMAGLAARAPHWKLTDKRPRTALKGARKIYRRARNDMETVATSGDETAMHDWRKAVKYHWFHTVLLRGISHREMEIHARWLKRLNDVLGDFNDLANLRDRLRDPGLPDARLAVLPVVEAEMARLEAMALALGEETLGLSPKKRVKRWRRWWAEWRKGK